MKTNVTVLQEVAPLYNKSGGKIRENDEMQAEKQLSISVQDFFTENNKC